MEYHLSIIYTKKNTWSISLHFQFLCEKMEKHLWCPNGVIFTYNFTLKSVITRNIEVRIKASGWQIHYIIMLHEKQLLLKVLLKYVDVLFHRQPAPVATGSRCGGARTTAAWWCAGTCWAGGSACPTTPPGNCLRTYTRMLSGVLVSVLFDILCQPYSKCTPRAPQSYRRSSVKIKLVKGYLLDW